MTSRAIERHIDESVFILCDVAIVTTDMLMPSQQGKARSLMHESDFGDVLPGVNSVAPRALTAMLAIVRIIVTNLAGCRRIREFQ